MNRLKVFDVVYAAVTVLTIAIILILNIDCIHYILHIHGNAILSRLILELTFAVTVVLVCLNALFLLVIDIVKRVYAHAYVTRNNSKEH